MYNDPVIRFYHIPFRNALFSLFSLLLTMALSQYEVNRRFDNIFAWYALLSGVLVSYLIHLPCESVMENIDRLRLNATIGDIHRAHLDANDGSSYYEDQCIHLWWRSAIFFMLFGGVLRIYQQRVLN